MKKLILFLFCIVAFNLLGQVSSVDLLMRYNCETNQYDVNLVILEGSATTIPHRAQFNSQISLVVPTGEKVEITEMYMPLNNNQAYNGVVPMNWYLGTPLVSPEAQPENDFYGVIPYLSPASFYNDLEAGDVVKLFSFIAGESGEYDENVRFYQNGIDPTSNESGMNNWNFANGFTMGGATQIYNNNSAESCITDVDQTSLTTLNVYPNPFRNQFSIELQEEIQNIHIVDVEGKEYYKSQFHTKGVVAIDASEYPSGVYYVRIVSKDGSIASRRIVKL